MLNIFTKRLALIPFFLSFQCYAIDAADVFLEASKSVVFIVTFDNELSKLSSGSGVVVDKNRVVTNCHVLEKAAAAKIKYKDDIYNVELFSDDVEHDLCLLNVVGL